MQSVHRVKLAYNNVYLLRSGTESLLIDTGPDYLGAREVLSAELTGIPDAVIATHGHLDHAGLGHWWEERGTQVSLHERDAHFAGGRQLDDTEFAGLAAFVVASGAPADVATEVQEGLEQRRAWQSALTTGDDFRPAGRDGRWPTSLHYRPFEPTRWLRGGREQLAAGAAFIHMPGHTPGNGVVWVEENGWLFSGDQLLPEITPTPAIQAAHSESADWRFRSLPEFLRSLAQVRELAPVRCFPGHGEPFDNVLEVVEANLAQAEQRTSRLWDILVQNPGQTLYRLAELLYPRALRRRFWQIIATVQGHLDVLEEAGAARIAEGRWFAC